VLGFSPKFGAVIQAIPLPVMGGVSHRGVRPDRRRRRQDLGRQPGRLLANKNLIVAAITLVLGTGDFTLKFGGFALGGIGTATFGAILLYACSTAAARRREAWWPMRRTPRRARANIDAA
jgi:putative pyrimidine permease RutG